MSVSSIQPNVTQNSTTQAQAQAAKSKTVKTSIFYINDIHSNLKNLEKLKTASDEFDSFVHSEKVDKLKFSAGDIGVGRDADFNRLAVDFQNSTHIMASAGGNHEFDLNKKDLSKILQNAKYKFMAINVEIPETSDENKLLKKEIVKSYVQEQNGEKYGVIGLMPFDFEFHLSDPDEYKDFNVLQIDKTVPLLQKEVDNFKAQGINKVILLSHAGFESDRELAKSVEVVDVIIGGHTHDLLKGIKEGRNLFYSKNTGEPTIITQAGKNGDNFGVLNLEFDEKGVIKKAQNNIGKPDSYPKSMVMQYFMNKILGEPRVVGQIKSAPFHRHSLVKENPSADFVLDAERSELGVDLVLINSGNFRSSFEPGNLTDRDLKVLTPFDNKVWVVKLTEPEVVEALKIGAKSFGREDLTPGIIQCSGLRYTVSKAEGLKEARYLDKDGKEIAIDINNPNPFKTYTVATDDFIAKGGNGYFKDLSSVVLHRYDFDKNKVVEDYFKHNPAPAEIKADGRINIVE